MTTYFRPVFKLPLLLTLLLSSHIAVSSNAMAQTLEASTLLNLGKNFCEDFKRVPAPELSDTITATAEQLLNSTVNAKQSDIEIRGRHIGQRVTINVTPSAILEAQLITPPGRPAQTVLTDFASQNRYDNNQPSTQLVMDSACELQQAQQIVYSKSQTPEFVQAMRPQGNTLVPTGEKNWVNPELPKLAPLTPPRFRVAMVDSGVNYQLPQIANSLARDEQGNLIGFDFWDMDAIPYDANPARSPYFVQRHGTRTASIVIAEAPGIAIVPYRYPRSDMSRIKELIEHAQSHDVRIIGMPLGSNDYKSWVTFERTAREHSDILFIVSAGNNGRDIDVKGVYPAAMDTPNMLVVTSADDFVKPAERTNYGRISVDYLIPAENIEALDYSGNKVSVSGSSYAVARTVALAGRLLNRNPNLTTTGLMKQIKALSIKARTGKYVAQGYLGDPMFSPRPLGVVAQKQEHQPELNTNYHLPVTVNILDQRWTKSKIDDSFKHLNQIFKQCEITASVETLNSINAPEYLNDLSTGHALSLRRQIGPAALSVFFADDTRMDPQFDAEAFGEGNTGNRPWMTNTLWLTFGIEDSGIALAHELFHIIANDGSHTRESGNLMQDRTNPANTILTKEQCDSVVNNGLAVELLFSVN